MFVGPQNLPLRDERGELVHQLEETVLCLAPVLYRFFPQQGEGGQVKPGDFHAAALRRKGQFGGIGVQKLRLPGGVKAGLPERGGAVCTPAQEHRPRQEQS